MLVELLFTIVLTAKPLVPHDSALSVHITERECIRELVFEEGGPTLHADQVISILILAVVPILVVDVQVLEVVSEL